MTRYRWSEQYGLHMPEADGDLISIQGTMYPAPGSRPWTEEQHAEADKRDRPYIEWWQEHPGAIPGLFQPPTLPKRYALREVHMTEESAPLNPGPPSAHGRINLAVNAPPVGATTWYDHVNHKERPLQEWIDGRWQPTFDVIYTCTNWLMVPRHR